MPRSDKPVEPLLRTVAALLLFAMLLTACGDSGDSVGEGALSASDSIATAKEIEASLAGERAPGAQAYSYRELYAGMTRATLERRTMRGVGTAAPSCSPAPNRTGELTCAYDALLGPDDAHVAVTATFTAGSTSGTSIARVITAVRELSIAVDGVRVAKALSDAFEKQTALLDRREATYGHHQAVVRMGTMNGERLNSATVTVAPKQGREELTVTLSRAGATPVPATPPAREQPKPGPAPKARS